MTDELRVKRLEQLRKYADWERETFPGGRVHILDWAAKEIEKLTTEVERLNLKLAEGQGDECWF